MFRRTMGSLVALALLTASFAADARPVSRQLQTKRLFAQHLNNKMWHKPSRPFDARNIRIVADKNTTPAGLCGPSTHRVTMTAANHKSQPKLFYKATAATVSGFGPPHGSLRVTMPKIDFLLQPRSAPPVLQR